MGGKIEKFLRCISDQGKKLRRYYGIDEKSYRPVPNPA